MQGGTGDPGGWRRVARGAHHSRIERNVIGRHRTQRAQPAERGRVAGIAVARRREVARILPGCIGPVVAAHADPHG